MEYLNIKTKGNSSPQGKSRVYFTCHPEDVEKYLDPVCNDLFEAVDCAVYYTPNMTAPIPEENKETDLGRINLFVIPVTWKLLTTSNRTMEEDFPFAKSHHIPVLPLMMESGLESLYSRPDGFGELQFLQPGVTDSTAIPYEEKLRKYLSSVLIDSETAERVRAAFDAYIFLSYRKKDRARANDLMRLIHRNPICRDIAIWYDEYLTPGESFNESIEKALEKCDLFTLLVTPNLVNEDNYVVRSEYPMAMAEGKRVLPVEVVSTDRDQLNNHFENLPEIVSVDDEPEFRRRLLNSFEHIAKSANDNDPAHNYLIGLAYMEGIDVEVDRERGLELITSAAEASLPEAMIKLSYMYREGLGVDLDYRKSLSWNQKLVDELIRDKGEDDPDTIAAIDLLGLNCLLAADYQNALRALKRSFVWEYQNLGDRDPSTLLTMSNLASAYNQLGNHEMGLQIEEKLYSLRCQLQGEDHPDTLSALSIMASTYIDTGDYRKAFELTQKVYDVRCRILGDEHKLTLLSMSNLAYLHRKLGDDNTALGLYKKVYEAQCRVIGENHPDTIGTLGNLEVTYAALGDYEEALKTGKKVFEETCRILGETHPDTLISMSNLASAYSHIGDYQEAVRIQEKAYPMWCAAVGEEHPNTLTALNNLAVLHEAVGDDKHALELFHKKYQIQRRVLGEDHPATQKSRQQLEEIRKKLEDNK